MARELIMTIEQIRMLSFGGGVDSTALLAIHLDRDKAAAFLEMTREQLDEAFPPMEAVVFSDPGSEWPETYMNIGYARERCEGWCQSRSSQAPQHDLRPQGIRRDDRTSENTQSDWEARGFIPSQDIRQTRDYRRLRQATENQDD